MALTASLKYFDTYEYVKKSKELGVSEQVAEYQVSQMEKAIEAAVSSVKDDIHAKDLATKSDIGLVRGEMRETELRLQKEIETVRNEISNTKIQTLVWIGINTAFMLSIIAKGFHWW